MVSLIKDYFNILPIEIILDILSRVPTESVLDCKLVSKTWNNLVAHNPSFSKMHLNHLNNHDSGKLGFVALAFEIDDKMDIYRSDYSDNREESFWYFEYDEKHESKTPIETIRRINFTPLFKNNRNIRFLGSCNGLICLAQGYGFAEKTYSICNPITKDYVMLPEIKKDSHMLSWTSGFGYVSSTDEYKVVGICRSMSHVQIYIYTLGSGNGWRNIGKFNSPFRCRWEQDYGIFASGALYWKDVEPNYIVTFDLAEERFFEYGSPNNCANDCWPANRIGVLNGSLSLANWVAGFEEDIDRYDVWLLKKRNDNHDMNEGGEHQLLVWDRVFSIHDGELFSVTKDDGVLTYRGHSLNIHNRRTAISHRLVKFETCIFRVSPHKNTLVSLKQLGEEDTKTMELVNWN